MFVYRWNPEHRDQYVHDVSSSINVLCSSLHNSMSHDCDPDIMVSLFTGFLTDIGNSYFEKPCQI